MLIHDSFWQILLWLCICLWQFRRLPSGIELPNSGEDIQSGECFMCQKCMNICPKQNVKTSTRKWHWFYFNKSSHSYNHNEVGWYLRLVN